LNRYDELKSKFPLISIIVPIYNRQFFLKNCIMSIINQSYRNLEVILVNDGSTDNSLLICKEFANEDSRVKIIDIKNSGVGTARNVGLQNAKGDFIQFVDSDDLITVTMCETLISNQIKYNADIVICGFDNIDKNGNHLFFECSDITICTIEDFYDNFGLLLEKNLLRSPVNKLYKKTIIDENNISFNTSFQIAEDALFNMTYYNYCHKTIVIPDILYYCTVHNETIRLTNRLHDDYFYIQNMFYLNIINLLQEKSAYTKKNKEYIICDYTKIILIGLNILAINNKSLCLDALCNNILYEIFPPSKDLDVFLYIVSKWILDKNEGRLKKIFLNSIFKRKISAVVYMKKNKLYSKKIYGFIKICFWQLIDVMYFIKQKLFL